MIGAMWRRSLTCLHGRPQTTRDAGRSYVRVLTHLDSGRKLYECNVRDGGCGKRWVL